MRRLQSAGVPAGAAYTTAQVLADVHFAERGFFRTVTHPALGTLRMEGVPFRAQNLTCAESIPAPLFGQHTSEVLQEWLGMSADEVKQVRDAGALA
jgi:crotonobetainyl-CoA:carnitine CoA-transferase CaiB-like acyl-CoA transferase